MARRILLSMFGWNDSGGGTVLPRRLAAELVRRGHEVTVFHAAVERLEGAPAYAVSERVEDGVRVVGVHNRASVMLDLGNPHREVDDPPVAAAFARVLDDARPDVIHWHNLHNLGATLVDEAFARGVRSVFTPHNLWLVCPRNHLVRADGTLCDGPADAGRACATCAGGRDIDGYARRREELRERVAGKVDRILAVSEAVRRLLVGAGYPAAMVDVVRQAMPGTDRVWDEVGRTRAPGPLGDGLVVGFIGSAYAHKGPQLLAEAAQAVEGVRVRIHGDVPDALAAHIRHLDRRGIVELAGRYGHDGLPTILGALDAVAIPSTIWDCAPLAVAEALAGRVPVLAARMGGVAEGVRDGVDGLVVDGRSADALAEALRRLRDEPGLLARLQAGIEEPRRWSDYVDELEERYAAPSGAPRPRAVDVPVTVRWTGDQAAVSSLAAINRAVAARLRARDDLRVARTAADAVLDDPPLPFPPEVEVRHAWPHDLTGPGAGRLALIQPWEFGAVPRAWVEATHGAVDEIWTPSAFVREMFVAGGVAPDRVHVVPNGVDLDVYRPDGPRADGLPEGRRLLFLGGTIFRKGIDLLVAAYREALDGRDDVVLVIKDVGSSTFYRGRNARAEIDRLAAAAGARIVVLDADLDDAGLAALYRACDVLVHPYRGEGFAMPVLEAMACGLPVAVTAGGPTDEFAPVEAGWRIASTRRAMAGGLELETVGEPWMLEPDPAALRAVLREAADATPAELAARGAAGRRAAEEYGWDRIAELYARRIHALAARPPRAGTAAGPAFALPEPRGRNLLAAPAWRGDDRLGELLAAWAAAFRDGDDVALYLLADPSVDGDAGRWEERVLAAADAAGVDLADVADIQVLEQVVHGDDLRRLVAAVDGLVPLHAATGGLERHAATAGTPVLAPDAAALRAWASRTARAAA